MNYHRIFSVSALLIPSILLADAPPPATSEKPTPETAPMPEEAPKKKITRQRRAVPQPVHKDDWAVGVTVGTAPAYPGASSYQAGAVPMVHYESESGIFVSPVEGVGFKSASGGFTGNVSLRYDGTGRHRDDNRRFAQWDSVHGAAAIFLSGEYDFGANYVMIGLNQRLTHKDEDGGLTHLEYGRTLAVFGKGSQLIQAGVMADLMDGEYANTFYSVSAKQASTSGLSPYDADGGLASYGVFVNYVWKINANTGLFVRATVERLDGDAGPSPIVGARTFGTAAISLIYHF